MSEAETNQGSATNGLGRLLNSPGKIAGVFFAVVGILVVGMRINPEKYDSPRFGSAHLPVEIVAALVVAFVLLTVPDRGQLGWRRGEGRTRSWLVLPLLAVGLAVLSAALTYASLPRSAAIDAVLVGRTVTTSLLVGFVEEVLFRGLLLVALVRALGIGGGVLVSSLCFGVVHGINVLGGAPIGQTLIQVTFTCILGTLFLLAAMGTRSLLLPILLHAVWDSAAFLNIYLQTLGASANAVSVLASALGVLGVVQTFRVVRRWTRGDIYPVQGLPQR